jgi:hypothetical protein
MTLPTGTLTVFGKLLLFQYRIIHRPSAISIRRNSGPLVQANNKAAVLKALDTMIAFAFSFMPYLKLASQTPNTAMTNDSKSSLYRRE